MDNSFIAYIQRLETLAFFSGYPLIFAIMVFMGGGRGPAAGFRGRLVTFLPYSYALVGTLFIGLQLKNLYPDYSFENIKVTILESYLKIWGLLSLLFWIPALAKKPILSLMHSLVFFFFLAKDLFLHATQSPGDRNLIRNEMKIYTDSLILNLGTLICITLVYFLFLRFKIFKNSP
jgi:hypothetical protein